MCHVDHGRRELVGGGVASCWMAMARVVEDLAVGVDESGFHLGSADVDCQGDRSWSHFRHFGFIRHG